MHVLVLDNYDSFTFNLVQYLGELGARTTVVKNDACKASELAAHAPDGLLLSPGPGTPDEAGITLETIRTYAGTVPIFGVCLGHQAIGQAFGGKVIRAERRMHGRTSPIAHDGGGVFHELPSPFEATRYHSLIVERASLPAALQVTAWTDEGEIMGLRHATLDVEGVQFHPESILTREGQRLLGNWLARVGRGAS
jgi:anthranilate synthase/aminodeoxychorismate synthase-like glutamine amidotransferase